MAKSGYSKYKYGYSKYKSRYSKNLGNTKIVFYWI